MHNLMAVLCKCSVLDRYPLGYTFCVWFWMLYRLLAWPCHCCGFTRYCSFEMIITITILWDVRYITIKELFMIISYPTRTIYWNNKHFFTLAKQNLPLSMYLLSFGVSLWAFCHECLSLISYATHYHYLSFRNSDFLIGWFVPRDTGLWRNNLLDVIVMV